MMGVGNNPNPLYIISNQQQPVTKPYWAPSITNHMGNHYGNIGQEVGGDWALDWATLYKQD